MFVCRRKILDRFLLRLFTFRLNLSWLGDVLASLGWKEIWGTWPPALDLDLALFISTWKIFMCGCKRHNSKRGSFWQASKRKFSQSEWKKWVMKSFSADFAYFQNRVYQVKKISQFRFGKILFWKPLIQWFHHHTYSWILDSMLIIHLIRWFFLVKNFWIFVYGNFSLYFMNIIVSNLGRPVWNLEKMLEPRKRKTNLGLSIWNLEKVLEPGKRKTNLGLPFWNLENIRTRKKKNKPWTLHLKSRKILEPRERKTNLCLPVWNLEKMLDPGRRQTLDSPFEI
jgi:hypothetical protein